MSKPPQGRQIGEILMNESYDQALKTPEEMELVTVADIHLPGQ